MVDTALTALLDWLVQLEKAATPGPWLPTPGFGHRRDQIFTVSQMHGPMVTMSTCNTLASANMDLISAMRNMLPMLIAAAREYEKLRVKLEATEQALVQAQKERDEATGEANDAQWAANVNAG